jgi:hypothetical protein
MACFNHLAVQRTTARPFIDAALLCPFQAELVKTSFLNASISTAARKKSTSAGSHAPVVCRKLYSSSHER